ncbi:DUF7545 family protein [Halomarina ordinaria]|uniref:CopG family transcriptional regulator n=1 Tax=Halomarina ordinaria TaxID=3033939 RepID=A0ABD5U588_9EURY|nr:hypothetical protein [Halomarina sp. PSRA2]
MTNDDTVQVSIDAGDGEDQVTLPSNLLDLLAEDGQNAAEVVGDLALMSCAQRIHATVHHSQGEVDERLQAIEDTTLDLFEERFGMSFGEATGHDH